MSRTSRVPYHQNVYDLLEIEPGEDPEAAQMIAAHEAEHGPLPLPPAVREWYLSSLALSPPTKYTLALDQILPRFLSGQPVPKNMLVHDDYSSTTWAVLDSGDNPKCFVRRDDYESSWSDYSPTFTEFLFDHITLSFDWFHPATGEPSNWLRTPAEPFAPPIIDFLTEQFGEPECIARPGDVTTYIWRPDGGTVRVTADHPAHPEPLSAWWVSAKTLEQREAFENLLQRWGTLSSTLCSNT